MTQLERKQNLASLPPALAPLERLALNIRWSWEPALADLFARIDPDAWAAARQCPVDLLARVSPDRLAELATDAGFAADVQAADADLDRYMERRDATVDAKPVVYLSMEYALHHSLPLYSGGLGVLSGDHLKSASDAGLPLLAVGLFYRRGYFTQRLDADGLQREQLPELSPARLPVQLLLDDDGEEHRVTVELAGRAVASRIWLLQVGAVTLYLLDTDVEENAAADRRISWQLYPGDRRLRLEQELLLGTGAVRLLEDALGLDPPVYHLNEGHCALSVIERARRAARDGLSFATACERVRERTVFTTHTPVAAGNEEFSLTLIDEYLGPAMADLGIEKDELHWLGRVADELTPELAAIGEDPKEAEETGFGLTVLALRLSRYTNAVSQLHGEVCRGMWRGVWPDRPVDDVPIDAITNGVHLGTWLGRPLRRLLTAHTEIAPSENVHQQSVWSAVDQIPAAELWSAHLEQKRELIDEIRVRIVAEGLRRGEDRALLEELAAAVDPGRLTIGFARRFATYKRATLLLEDPDALAALLGHPERPAQLVLAGKAHPMDRSGKKLIQAVFAASRDERFRGRIIFLEDYDMVLGRLLTGGVDLWLNNPLRPLEACGTSGMKAALNGVLNCSIRDGWWDEVERVGYGFSIEGGEGDDRDRADREATYSMLQRSVVPLYYDADADGVPHGWIDLMRASIRDLSPRYAARRMVEDYRERAYTAEVSGSSASSSPPAARRRAASPAAR